MSRLNRIILNRKKYSNWSTVLCKVFNVRISSQLPPTFLNHLAQYNEVMKPSIAGAFDTLLIKNGGSLNESLKQIDRAYRNK